jgi:hypothetical protein
MRALLWRLFARSAWAQQATVLAGKTGEGAALDYDRQPPTNVLTKGGDLRGAQVDVP